jgi:hypothetical protein
VGRRGPTGIEPVVCCSAGASLRTIRSRSVGSRESHGLGSKKKTSYQAEDAPDSCVSHAGARFVAPVQICACSGGLFTGTCCRLDYRCRRQPLRVVAFHFAPGRAAGPACGGGPASRVSPQRQHSGIRGIGSAAPLLRRATTHRWIFRVGGQRRCGPRNAYGSESTHRQCVARTIGHG